MATAQPLRNYEKKKVVLFFGLTLQHQIRKSTSKAKTGTVRRQGNGNDSSYEDVRNLCKQGLLKEALHIAHLMDQPVDTSTYACLLQMCIKKKALSQGRVLHTHMNEIGFMPDVFLGNTLANMYAKCGSLVDARRVFDKMPKRDVVSWTAMIASYSSHGYAEEALTLFNQMQQAGIQPNQFTFTSVLPACAKLAALGKGMELHEEIIRSGFHSHVFVANALIDMYAKCGRIRSSRNLFDKMHQRDVVSWNAMMAGYLHNRDVDEALKVFQEMPERNVVSWTAMIAGYVQHGQDVEALQLFRQMQEAGVRPKPNTFVSLLPACAKLVNLENGMELHEEIIRSGFQSHVSVANALIDMYAKCGGIDNARKLFDKMQQRDVVSWTVMIAGYAQNEDMEEAQKLFQEMPEKNAVSWTAIIAGYVQNGQGVNALHLFQQMQLQGVKPTPSTFARVLSACADLAALEQGMEIHEDIIKNGLQSELFVENALIDMYAKCGSIETAREVFDKMHQRDVISWTAMIGGYAMHGCGNEALKLFEQMQHSGMNPDQITLVCILSACCHAGLVEEGCHYFDCMSQYYQITPSIKHYVCMVDILGRAGHLDEALDIINKMPMEPGVSVWSCLLGACRMHNNIELGEHVAEQLFELDPQNSAPFVLLSNIYAAAGRWEDSENVWRMMKDRRIKKMPGCSWIEVNKQVHAFLVGDMSHPQTQKIYAKLE
eukprot:Gb_21937 [translate_table: standard]